MVKKKFITKIRKKEKKKFLFFKEVVENFEVFSMKKIRMHEIIFFLFFKAFPEFWLKFSISLWLFSRIKKFDSLQKF